MRQGKGKDATALAASIGDPVAAKLVEWATAAPLRQRSRFRPLRRLHPRQSRLAEHGAAAPARGGEAVAGAARRRHGAPLRRRASRPARSAGLRSRASRWQRATAPTPRARFARCGSRRRCRPKPETAVLAAFPDVLTRADHVARMDRRIGAKDFGAAMRAAKRVGEDQVAIVKACSRRRGEIRQGRGAARCGPRRRARGFGLRVVPSALAHAQRHARLQYSRPHRDAQGGHCGCGQADARRARRRICGVRTPTNGGASVARLARKLLDLGDAATAYQVVRSRRAAGQSLLPCRSPLHGRLDRAALSRRSGCGARAFRPHR